jgi:hypothetical protein
MSRSLRDEMPATAAWVDAFRDAFGEEAVTAWMRGQDGGWFCAEENGNRWCTPGRVCERCKGNTNG